MNKDNAKDYLPLVQALAEGKTIQVRRPDDDVWTDAWVDLKFVYGPSCYRIKPEPREIFVEEFNFGGELSRENFLEKERALETMSPGNRVVKFREVIE